MSRSRSLLLLVAAALAATACSRTPQAGGAASRATPAPRSARELVAQMKAHYDGRWYNTLAFRQENVSYTSGGENRSAWMERQHVPRRLRIDFVSPVADGSGILFRSDSVYSFQNGKLAQSAPQLHPLLLLSADVYALPVDTTMAGLATLRIDTTVIRRDRWQDTPVWVVGAAAGDSASNQFWVDADRWVLLRLVQSQQAGGRTVRTDHHFSYQMVDSLPVPHEIVFLRGGAPYWRETYVDVVVNPPVPDSIFAPSRWTQGVPPAPRP